jgi:16S rRNA (uracil1498-N3)-methyltransferase
MKLHRFYLQSVNLGSAQIGQEIQIFDNETIHQLKDVFRFEKGDVLSVFDGSAQETHCTVVEIRKKEILLTVSKPLSEAEKLVQKQNFTLAFALLKGEHTEMVLEKCTELGVTKFQPLTTDRTIKTGFRRDRLEKIIKEATEQCGFVRLPMLAEPIKIEQYLKSLGTKSVFVMDMGGNTLPHSSSPYKGEETVIVIGPEGGWSGQEHLMFKGLSLQTFSLCPQTLRAETACISSVSQFLV